MEIMRALTPDLVVPVICETERPAAYAQQ
jgi:hypothetical protein